MVMRPPKKLTNIIETMDRWADGKIIETEVPGLFFYNLFSHIAFAFLVTWEALSPSSWEAYRGERIESDYDCMQTDV